MKKIKIYQLNLKSEESRRLLFEGYDRAMEIAKDYPTFSLDLYDEVYECEVKDDVTLDDIYFKFNGNRPDDYDGHSLSVSDIVMMEDKYYYCDSFGWEEVEF